MTLSPEQLCTKNAAILRESLEYAYSLTFEEVPNYNKLIHLFTKLILDENEVPNSLFDWSPPSIGQRLQRNMS